MPGPCHFRVVLVTGDVFVGSMVQEDAEKIILRVEEQGRPPRTLRLYLRFVAAVEELGCAPRPFSASRAPSPREVH